MNHEDVSLLFEYNDWANERILTAAKGVGEDQFLAVSDRSFGSLRGTLLHILDVEVGWRTLVQHNRVAPDLQEADFPTLEAMAQRWQDEQLARREYLLGLKDEDISGIVRYTTSGGLQRARVLWHIHWHIINHGTQHRSEAAVMLTEMGHSPGDLDFVIFMTERGERQSK